LKEIFANAKPGDPLKKFLVPNTGLNFFIFVVHFFNGIFLDYGPALIEHVLLGVGFVANVKFGNDFNVDHDCGRVHKALCEADIILTEAASKPSKVCIFNHNFT
jgi:hypothetical protein